MNYEIINEAKKRLGITNAQLADSTGISLSTLDKITSGKKNNPTLDTLQAIADAIGCSIDDFRDAPSSQVSLRAMDVARAYDKMSAYGKDMIDQIIVCEGKYKVTKRIPSIEEIAGVKVGHDSVIQAKYNARQEQKELVEEEYKSRLLR